MWTLHTDSGNNIYGGSLRSAVGLYYYGARYLDPKYSRWISTDPALGEYIPKAPIDEEAKKYNQNLPGMGGVFNHINGNLYHYAANNPVKYTDPDGRSSLYFYFWGFVKSISTGKDKFSASCLQYANASRASPAKVDMDSLIGNLNKTPYGTESTSNERKISERNSNSSYRHIILEKHPLDNLATALPKQSDATLEDIPSDGIPSRAESVGNAAIFGLSVSAKLFRGVSDVKLNYTVTNGKVTNWSVTVTGLNYKDEVINQVLSKDEALDLLNANKENVKYYDNNALENLNNSL